MRLPNIRVMRGAASGTTWSAEPTGRGPEIADSKGQLRLGAGSTSGGRTALGVTIEIEGVRAVLPGLAMRLTGALRLLAEPSYVDAQQSVAELTDLASSSSLVDANLEGARFR